MRYLLDTNICSDLVRNGAGGRAFPRLEMVGAVNCCTSVIVACEAAFGVEKKGSETLDEKVSGFFSRIAVMPLTRDVTACYARVRWALERGGTPIGANDTLIAAHCLALNAILVTDNVREFERVAGLSIENWLE